MKDVQCYEVLGGIVLKNQTFYSTFSQSTIGCKLEILFKMADGGNQRGLKELHIHKRFLFA